MQPSTPHSRFPHPSHRAQKHPPTHISRLIHHIGKGESKNMGCVLLSGDKKLSKRKNRGPFIPATVRK